MKHSLCPEEKGRTRRRSSPGLSLIVGGISRLGGIAHDYLINSATVVIVVAILGAVAPKVTLLAAAQASTSAHEMVALVLSQRGRVSIIVAVVVVVAVAIVERAVHVAELAVDIVELELDVVDFHCVGVSRTSSRSREGESFGAR